MNNKKLNRFDSYKALLLLSVIACTIIACKKYLPEERETVGADSQFIVDTYQPILGRTTVFTGNFFKGSTTFPSTFRIVNPRRRNGDAAPELMDTLPIKVWKKAYDGSEKSIAEIEAKRELQYRPVLEVGPHSGELTMWSSSRSSFIRPLPDSGYLFDVELSNSGGRRYYRNLKLMPFREKPFEPSNYDAISGQPLSNGVFPSFISNIKGVATKRYLGGQDIDVYIRKINMPGTPSTNTITFKFLDTLYHPINPALFSNTNWPELIHGFDMQMTETEVKYSVAFPIPLAEVPTKYTDNDGKRARVRFGYSRLGFGGVKEDAQIGLDFAIYEPGDWEIVFAFKNDNPKFSND
ncbi:MAG: DUF5007 domain-containing protein [Flavisolibacter sp.]|jgi:hypothetical protein